MEDNRTIFLNSLAQRTYPNTTSLVLFPGIPPDCPTEYSPKNFHLEILTEFCPRFHISITPKIRSWISSVTPVRDSTLYIFCGFLQIPWTSVTSAVGLHRQHHANTEHKKLDFFNMLYKKQQRDRSMVKPIFEGISKGFTKQLLKRNFQKNGWGNSH